MNMRKSLTVVLFLVFLLGSMFFPPSGVSPATIIWEEDFESDLDNWKIFGVENFDIPRPGNFSIIDGTLRITGNTTIDSIIEHPSTQATGTWSFDVDVTHSPRNHFYIAFFGGKFGDFTGKVDFAKACPFEYGVIPVPGSFGSWYQEFVFYKRVKGSLYIEELGSFSPPQILGWHHFDITRNIEGEFNIFINGSHCKLFQDTTYNTTEVFKFYGSPGPGLDNIVVYDHFTIMKRTNASGWTFIVGLFALSIIFRKKLLYKR
ncbi:MAG: hypothetical protein ACFFDI_32580 [Promethearchaeota archaeon]